MSEAFFDHDRLDAYRLSINYVASSFAIPLNIAEGNGKRSLKDRSRFLDIARGSALESAAIQDVLIATDTLDDDRNAEF